MTQKIYLKKLDSIRGIACIYVLAHNWAYTLYKQDLVNYQIKLIFSAGQEAVMVFFLISGFVVHLSMERQPHLNFREYFIKRFRRIYFPLIISMIVSIIIGYLNGNLSKRFSWRDLVGTLLLLQDFGSVKPGTWFYPFMGNLPLWTLSYEWWFYLMYYPIYKALTKSYKRIYIVLSFSGVSYISYVIFPNQASLICSYFIIWWSGVELARVFRNQGKFSYNKIRPILFCLFLMALISFIPVLKEHHIKPGHYPFLMFRHFSAALILVTLGWIWYKINLVGFEKIMGIFSKVAPISYALYVLHFPILVRWQLTYNSENFLVRSYAINFIVLIVLAYLTEIKLQPIVNRWIK